MILLLFAVLLAIVCLLLWWLLVETEGVYLGRRVVIALYDLFAPRYDRVKAFDEGADLLLLSEPLLDQLQRHASPLILDIATGTGRLPLVLARNARFEGHVIGLDRSRGMLNQARRKVAAEHFQTFISLLRSDAIRLPFPDESFDAATCLEALEFLPDATAALQEMNRVLRPGGTLLLSLRIDMRWMPGRVHSQPDLRRLLDSLGLEAVEFEDWQSDYIKVWARKPPANRHILRARIC